MNIDFDKYKMTFDVHTHTTYSRGTFTPHGKGTMEENVRSAVNQGLTSIGISDHGPGHMFYGLDRDKIPEMKEEIERLRKEYPQIEIYFSVEANILQNRDNCLDITRDETKEFDFILAGYHFGTPKSNMIGNWIDNKCQYLITHREQRRFKRDNTAMIVSAILNNDIHVLTHPGDKARVDIEAIAEACAKKDTWMEISNWHEHLTVEEIKVAMKKDVNFIISSDAHSPGRVGSFKGGLTRALQAGLPIERIVNIEEVK